MKTKQNSIKHEDLKAKSENVKIREIADAMQIRRHRYGDLMRRCDANAKMQDAKI